MNSTGVVGWRSEPWVFDEQCRDAFELVEETVGEFGTAFPAIETHGLEKIGLCIAVQRV